MKRVLHFLVWVLGVALGVVVFFGVVLGGSYALTTEAKLPESTAAAGETVLEQNGYRWHLPLLGGAVDKAFAQPETLAVQKLGTLADPHPTFTVPDWVNYSELTVENQDGTVLFRGTLGDYNTQFVYPANGEYKVQLRLWHLPSGMSSGDFAAQGEGPVLKNHGLETPVKPSGYYHYTVRFTLAASPTIELSASSAAQGEAVGVLVTGMLGSSQAPTADCDLGPVVFEQLPEGWRGYLPVAYNAEAGDHLLTVTSGEYTAQTTLRVTGRDFGRAETDGLEEGSAGGTEFRNKIWSLYTAESGPKAWTGRWVCPSASYKKLVSYGQIKVTAGQAQGRSNSSVLVTTPGDELVAPAGGTVVFAGPLELTGQTLVIDHGCGVRTYLYGLGEIYLKKGDTVVQNGPLGTAGELLTLDVKIGSKSIDPWALFQGSGGLFWRE